MVIEVLVAVGIGFLLGWSAPFFYRKFKDRKKDWTGGYKVLKYESKEVEPQENKEEQTSIFPPGMGF